MPFQPCLRATISFKFAVPKRKAVEILITLLILYLLWPQLFKIKASEL